MENNKYYVKRKGSSQYSGPFTCTEIAERIRSDSLAHDSEMLLSTGQSYAALKASTQWVPIPRDPEKLIALDLSLASSRLRPLGTDPQKIINFALAGLAAGFLVGILTRPAVPLLGQLPLSMVLSRGANLTGMDLLLKPTAETSFNHVILLAAIGGIVGSVAGWYLGSARGANPEPSGPPQPVLAEQPAEGAGVVSERTYCARCGSVLPPGAAFCPSCGAKRATTA